MRWSKFNLRLGKRTYLMGILNRTPDSFSDGGNFMPLDTAVSHAKDMVRQGADIIDVGGESTRPGSSGISTNEELERVIPVIERLSGTLDVPISIDTSKAAVADAAIKSGASMINDITGLRGDPGMAAVAALHRVPLVAMHIKGTPRTMQSDPHYEDLIGEILAGLKGSIDMARAAGVDEDMIIVDPGIGFGKSLEDNLQIIRELGRFRELGRPVMVGPSRKSFIGAILERGMGERLMGTASAVALSIAAGADIVRVHDVKEMSEVVRVADSIWRT